jgi:LmbE family N-acetylglucosaminyl deacetylase
MRILYIFPHPDDESFGPAPVIGQQIENGHQVFLLTLTKGGATKARHKLGLSIEQMGEIRYREMLQVEKLLQLSGMTVLDLPDSGLQEMDPREIEKTIAVYIEQIQPQLVVSYPVHGCSGYHDHLVTHAVVKRVFLELKTAEKAYLKRLAFITFPNKVDVTVVQGNFVMKQSDPRLIDCEVQLKEKDIDLFKQALSCYETYRERVVQSDIINMIGDRVYFEIYNEDHKPVLSDLTTGI